MHNELSHLSHAFNILYNNVVVINTTRRINNYIMEHFCELNTQAVEWYGSFY